MIGNISIALTNQDLVNLVEVRKQCRNSIGPVIGIQEFNKTKIVVINDMDSHGGSNYIVGSILLPDSKSMMALIDGDYATFKFLYHQKLANDPQVQEYLVVLLAGLVERNFDYIFYFDSEDPYIFNYLVPALLDYLVENFGLVFYEASDFIQDPKLVCERSVDGWNLPKINNLIRQYKISNKPDSLFISF